MGKLQRHTAAQHKHIPHHQSRSKDGYPWIGPKLKKMMKHYHKLKKKIGEPQHVKGYLDLKHQVHNGQGQVYREYVGSIVTPQDKENEYAGM